MPDRAMKIKPRRHRRSSAVGNTTGTTNLPTPASTDVIWYRVTSDGTKLSVQCQQNASEPTWGTLGGTPPADLIYESSDFDFSGGGGMIGFAGSGGGGAVAKMDNFTLKLDLDANGSYETTAHKDDFTVDANAYAEVIDSADFEAHDAAGNLTWDGAFAYTYDAWNRLVKVDKAYRAPSSGTLTVAYTVDLMRYDGLNRRIVKAVQNSGDLDCTYHYYYDSSWRLLETRNGSDQVIKQQVWGQMYIDELVQIGVNDDPGSDDDAGTAGTQDYADTFYYAEHDANFNVIGLVDNTGALVERYDYTPYGQRTVYFTPGTNDDTCHAATTMSRRVQVSSVDQPYGLNDFGHQGLMHDEESGLTYNRYRFLLSRFGRFMQRDPVDYVDGSNLYSNARSNPIIGVDPLGLQVESDHMLIVDPPVPTNETCDYEGKMKYTNLRPNETMTLSLVGPPYTKNCLYDHIYPGTKTCVTVNTYIIPGGSPYHLKCIKGRFHVVRVFINKNKVKPKTTEDCTPCNPDPPVKPASCPNDSQADNMIYDTDTAR